jgi:hypothetical protein
VSHSTIETTRRLTDGQTGKPTADPSERIKELESAISISESRAAARRIMEKQAAALRIKELETRLSLRTQEHEAGTKERDARIRNLEIVRDSQAAHIRELGGRIKELTLYSADCETRIGQLESDIAEQNRQIQTQADTIRDLRHRRITAAVAKIREDLGFKLQLNPFTPDGVATAVITGVPDGVATAVITGVPEYRIARFIIPEARLVHQQSTDQCYGNEALCTEHLS